MAEDEPLVRELITAGLTHSGYTVLQAGDGREALEVAERHGRPIDLLLTDIVMPHMNGDELAATFAEQYPSTVILTMSAHRDVAPDRGSARPLLAKPFAIDALKRTLREMLDAAPRRCRDEAV